MLLYPLLLYPWFTVLVQDCNCRLDLKSGKFGLIYHKGTDGGGRITYYIESYKVDKNATVEINSEEDPEKKGELL